MPLPWICCSAFPGLSFTGEPSTGPNIQMCFPRAKERRRITSLHLLAWCSPRCCWLFATRTHCWLMVNFLGLAPGTFLQTCLPVSQIPARPGIWGCSSPNASPCNRNFWRYFYICFSSLTMALWTSTTIWPTKHSFFPHAVLLLSFFGLPRMGHSGA